MAEAFEKSRAAGCDAHLTKPIQKTVLVRAVSEMCKTQEPICIHPSEEIAKLAPWYLDRRRSDLVALAAALQAHDYQKIRTMGHDMKGSGVGYGFEEITKIGASLEAAAKQESGGEIGNKIEALSHYLNRVEIV